MRAKTSLLVPLILACAAWAQTAATPPKAQSAAKVKTAAPAAPTKVAPVAKAIAAPAVTKTAPKASKPAAGRRVPTAKLKASAVAPEVKPPVRTASKPVLHPGPHRDPFISPVVKAGTLQPCTTGGKKCLAVGEIVLKGVAKTDNGMLAMVENSGRKAYFLRENDPVFNGYVVKITMDSVVLRESVMDRLGHQSTRDVTKKIIPTPVG